MYPRVQDFYDKVLDKCCCVPKINSLSRAILFYWDIQQRDEFYSGATRYYPPIRMGVRIRGLSLYNLSGTFVLRD